MYFQQKISSSLAFTIIIIFGLTMTIMTIKIGSGIVSDFSNSEIVKIPEKELNKDISK